MKYLTIIYLMTLTLPYTAQVINFKDGVSMGQRSEVISGCTNGTDKKLMTFNGMEIEMYKWCTCLCDNLIPIINSWEMERAMKENKLTDLFLKDENLEILIKCLEGKIKIDDDYKYEYSENPELQKKVGIKICVNDKLNDGEVWTKELAEEYCDCKINKLLSAGYTYKDILEIEDENSVSFNEVALPCFSQVFKTNTKIKPSNSYSIYDIKGEGYRSLIPLIDYLGQGYKIKINISGSTKYYLLDTGASDLIINRDMEIELLLDGVLKKENYLNKTEYTLANNQTVQAQMVKVDNIIIGDYTLSNVVIGIIDEGSLLCGLSFLDKFKKWEIDKQNNFLILYK